MLTELSVQSLKPKAQRYMRADRDGLYIEVVPGGQKYWWYVSQAGGKRKKVSIGKWPDISLKAAREMLVQKKRAAGIATFSPDVPDVLLTEVAEEWFRVEKSDYSEGYQKRIRRWMRDYLVPRFSGRTIASITAPEILEVCRGIEDKGQNETAHRVRCMFSEIFEYATPFYVQGDPAAVLRKKLKPVQTRHRARLTRSNEVAELMRGIANYPRPRVRNAMLLSAYTFVRQQVICGAEWSEIDFGSRQWRVPAAKMKMRQELTVPLADQVVALLEDQRARIEAAGLAGRYVFPSERSANRTMSLETVRLGIRWLGWGKDEMSAHGFRGMACTLLNESGLWSVDAIETQLAHTEHNKVREAYNNALYLPERMRMMQWWADELDRLRDEVAKL